MDEQNWMGVVYTNTECCMPKSNINVDYSSIKIATKKKINQTLS